MRVVSKYEVSCPSCKVSYPVGQKQCVHCGGRTAPSVVEVPDIPPQLHQGTRQISPEPELPADAREMVFMPTGSDEEELARGGSMLSRLGGLTWILIFAVVTIIRACFGGE
jgi:hypothetical protein